MYEVMRHWDSDDLDQHDPDSRHDLRAFAEAWRAMPKWVISQTLREVGPNATLVTENLETFARKLKSDVTGEIQVAGPDLADSLGQLGLVDEYHIYLRPVVLGHGKPYFKGARPKLKLVESERVGEDALRLILVP